MNLRTAVSVALLLGLHFDSRGDGASVNPSADTFITQQNTADPNRLDVGTNGQGKSNRALMQFDVAGNLPANATIVSATLTVTVVNVPQAPAVNSMFDLHAVLVPWDETQATWTNRLTGTPWSVPGGAPGVDFASVVSQTNFFDSSIGAHTFVSSPGLVADVQDWLTNASANHGWIIISELEGTLKTTRGLASRENPGNTPAVLAIQYTVPAPPTPSLVQPLVTNGIFQFSFDAASNHAYTAEYNGDLAQTNWITLTNFSPQPATANHVVSDPLTPGNRFYRVLAQ